MSVPGIVERSLDGEEIAARVSLGGEDELYVTPTRTLIYRADGLLSDESVEEYDHDADRLVVSEGRRKTRFSLEYPLDGTQEFTLPAKHADKAIHPILAGMLNAGGVTAAGEAVLHTYRFSELTLVITSDRIVKHIGEAVWDSEYEEFPFDRLTGIDFEEGEHATQLVLDIDGRPERIKAPNDEAPRVREHLKQALFDFYDVQSMDALHERIAPNDPADPDPDDAANVDFGEGVDPLEANPPASGMDPSAQTDSATEELTDDRFDPNAGSADPDNGSTEDTSTASTTAAEPAETTSETRRDSASESRSPTTEQGSPTRSDRDSGQEASGQSPPPEQRGQTDRSGQPERTDRPDERRDADAGTEAAVANSQREPVNTTPERPSDAGTADPSVTEANADAAGAQELAAAGFEPADDGTDALHAEIEELRSAVEKQNKLLARQQQTIEQLIEELRRGR